MCPLCSHPINASYHTDKRRNYLQCQQCELVFVEPNFLPTKAAEKLEYDKHENHFDDLGYVRFLSKVINNIEQYPATPFSKALDFGCGPAPVLAQLLEQSGYQTSFYDPIYFPSLQPLKSTYDLITCTEAIEHFHNPSKEWRQLNALLNKNGTLVVMTKRVLSQQKFSQWHYKNDPTHVSFFSENTFRYLANAFNLQLSLPLADIAVFRKP